MVDVPSFAPTEEQDLIRSTARQFLSEKVGIDKVREVMMSEDGHDAVLWKSMADLGWTGLVVRPENGGADLGPVELGVLLEEMGRLVTPGPFFASAVLATTAIGEVATREQQADLLPSMVAGDTIATLAIFETARGWSPDSPSTSATRNGSGWVLTGEKRAVLAGETADVVLVTGSEGDGVGLFAVERTAHGVTVVPEPVLDPTRRQARVIFDSVRVDSGARLGEGDVTPALQRTLALATAALAAEQVGGAQQCLDMSVEYAKSRYQFGRPIGSYQAIKHRCANMLVKVEHAKSAAYYAARVSADHAELAVAAPLAGSVASEAYVWVAGETIQVHGGIGFTWEHDAHIYLKRAKTSSLLLGSPGHQRDLLGRAIAI